MIRYPTLMRYPTWDLQADEVSLIDLQAKFDGGCRWRIWKEMPIPMAMKICISIEIQMSEADLSTRALSHGFDILEKGFCGHEVLV